MRHHKYLLIGSVALLCSCAFEVQESEGDGEQIGSRSSAMANGITTGGNRQGAVAIYHQHYYPRECYWWRHCLPARWEWSERPCSGVYLGERGGNHYVLTGRHCVTAYGEPQERAVYGPLVTPDRLRVTANVYTGPYTDAARDAATEVVEIIDDAPDLGNPDIVLLRLAEAPADQSPDLKRFSLYLGPNTSAFRDWWNSRPEKAGLLAYGFGNYVLGDNSTSGILRHGVFPIAGASSDVYWFDNTSSRPSSPAAHICSGDSGGPDFLRIDMGGQEHRLLTGIHHQLQNACDAGWGINVAVTAYAEWIQQKLGGLYLSSMSQFHPEHDVVPVYRSEYGTQRLQALSPGEHTSFRRFIYDDSFGSIRWAYAPYKCFHVDDPDSASGPILLRPCQPGLNTQRWIINEKHEIRLAANPSACIRMSHSSGYLHLVSCWSSETQRWLFHAMPSPAL
jgi:hypothetical protein